MKSVVLLVGGVGGAKLALGLSKVLSPDALTIIVNTADDFEHLGLHISPDVDTLMYTLAEVANPATGWGMAGDTFQAMEIVAQYDGPDWFRLGDKDLGTNLLRTALLREGHTLTEITVQFCKALGIKQKLLPMSDQPVRTILETDRGAFTFQEYFVRERWQPLVKSIHYEGAEKATPSPDVMQALKEATLIVFGPSNPFLSLDPILALPGIRESIVASPAPCLALSPIIGGQAVKGPAAKLMVELGHEVSPLGVARHYQDLLSGMILDEIDTILSEEIESLGITASPQKTLMTTLPEKIALAQILLDWIKEKHL